MSNETFVAILTFLGAVTAALMFILDRTNRRVADSLPPDTLNLMYGLLSLAETLAKSTPTPADDDLVRQLREAFGQPETTTTPAEPGTEG